jgi:hypothetical protein
VLPEEEHRVRLGFGIDALGSLSECVQRGKGNGEF